MKCSKCKLDKPIYTTKDNKKRYMCISCKKEYDKTRYIKNKDKILLQSKAYREKEGVKEHRKNYCKEWYVNNKEHMKNYGRQRSLKVKYNLTLEEYSELLKQQNYLCAICNITLPKDKLLHVDHSHLTGEVRGLLCGNCNRALGFFKDNVSILKKAIKYLKGIN